MHVCTAPARACTHARTHTLPQCIGLCILKLSVSSFQFKLTSSVRNLPWLLQTLWEDQIVGRKLLLHTWQNMPLLEIQSSKIMLRNMIHHHNGTMTFWSIIYYAYCHLPTAAMQYTFWCNVKKHALTHARPLVSAWHQKTVNMAHSLLYSVPLHHGSVVH